MLSMAPAVSTAQTVLTTKDGMTKFEGELTKIDESAFYLESELGELILPGSFVDCSGEGCPAVLDGDQIVLTASGGSIRLEGKLVGVSETDIVILTSNGELTVRRELVSCEGPACPDAGVHDTVSQMVTLTALGHDFSLQDELLEITENDYLIVTSAIGNHQIALQSFCVVSRYD